MKRVPNSKTNLDKAIQRFAGEIRRANELRTLMANAIVAQMIGEGVVKGGSGLRFRYGDKRTRATLDLEYWGGTLCEVAVLAGIGVDLCSYRGLVVEVVVLAWRRSRGRQGRRA